MLGTWKRIRQFLNSEYTHLFSRPIYCDTWKLLTEYLIFSYSNLHTHQIWCFLQRFSYYGKNALASQWTTSYTAALNYQDMLIYHLTFNSNPSTNKNCQMRVSVTWSIAVNEKASRQKYYRFFTKMGCLTKQVWVTEKNLRDSRRSEVMKEVAAADFHSIAEVGLWEVLWSNPLLKEWVATCPGPPPDGF